MEINLQILESVRPVLYRLLRTSEAGGIVTRSLSGLFKALRREQRISLIGDYPIISWLLRETRKKFPSHKWSKAQMYHALNFCRFWEEEGRKKKYIPHEWLRYVKNEQ